MAVTVQRWVGEKIDSGEQNLDFVRLWVKQAALG
jgi:hypothetical protein